MTVDTGNNKMDEAYNKMKIHISSFTEFSKFYDYFMKIKKTDDDKTLIKWLLKVLFVQLKITDSSKHEFDVLLESISKEERVKLESWLKSQLKKVGVK